MINMKTTPKVGKVASIQLVDDTTEMMVISQFGKIIRIDTKQVRSGWKKHLGSEAARSRPGRQGCGCDDDSTGRREDSAREWDFAAVDGCVPLEKVFQSGRTLGL